MAKLQLLASTTLAVLLLAATHLPVARAEWTLCNMTQGQLKSCKPAVSKPKPAAPSAACCSALSGADLSCLCDYMKNHPTTLRLLGINPGLATQLPAKCNIPLPAKC